MSVGGVARTVGSGASEPAARALEAMRRALAAMPTCNVIVAGRAGVGKSTLLNAVFGRDVAATGSGLSVTKGIRRYALPETNVAIFDAPGVELGQGVDEQIAAYEAEIDRRARQAEAEYLHMLWYCVSAVGAPRFEDFELRFIEALSPKVTTILVFTQCLDAAELGTAAFRADVAGRGLTIAGMVDTLAMPRVVRRSTVPAHGLVELVGLTRKHLPAATRHAFVNAECVALEDKADEARIHAERDLGQIRVTWRRLKAVDGDSVAPGEATREQLLEVLADIAAIFGQPTGAARTLAALAPLAVGAPSDRITPGPSLQMVSNNAVKALANRRQGIRIPPVGWLAIATVAIAGTAAAADAWDHHKAAVEVKRELRASVLASIRVFHATAVSEARGKKLTNPEVQRLFAREREAALKTAGSQVR